MSIEINKAVPISSLQPAQRDNKGRFVTGSKIAGRPKGSLQATSRQVRDILTNILSDHLPQVYQDLAMLSPKDRVAAIIAISQIVVPRMSAIAVGNAEGEIIKKQVFLIGGKEIEF
jgi:hypothetical protein